MSVLRRFVDRMTESDEERLRAEIRGWAAAVVDVTPIAEAPNRQHVRLAGVVRSITVWPRGCSIGPKYWVSPCFLPCVMPGRRRLPAYGY